MACSAIQRYVSQLMHTVKAGPDTRAEAMTTSSCALPDVRKYTKCAWLARSAFSPTDLLNSTIRIYKNFVLDALSL